MKSSPVSPSRGPLDVHGSAVVLLDGASQPGELQDGLVIEAEAPAVFPGDLNLAGGAFAPFGVDDLFLLAAEVLSKDGTEALLQRRLEDVVFVGIHRPAHHVLAQAPGGVDQDDVGKARLGIEGEQDPGGALVRAHHLLHSHREGDVEVAESLVVAIGDGAVGEQGGEAAEAGLQELLLSPDVEVGLLLSGKGRLGQVLGGGAGAHRHIALAAVLLLQLPVRLADRLGELLGKIGRPNRPANPAPHRRQVVHRLGVELVEDIANLLIQAGLFNEKSIGAGGDGEPAGNADSLWGKAADHLPQRSVLAPHPGDVVLADVLEP